MPRWSRPSSSQASIANASDRRSRPIFLRNSYLDLVPNTQVIAKLCLSRIPVNDKLEFIGHLLIQLNFLEDGVVRVNINAGRRPVKFYFVDCLPAGWF